MREGYPTKCDGLLDPPIRNQSQLIQIRIREIPRFFMDYGNQPPKGEPW